MANKEAPGRKEIVEDGRGTRFTSDNQPSPEAKSKGKKASLDRRKIKDWLYEEFDKTTTTKDGEEVTTWGAFKDLLKEIILNDGSGIGKADKAKLIIKLFDLVAPKDLDANITIDEVPEIVFRIVSSDKSQDKTKTEIIEENDRSSPPEQKESEDD